MAKVHIETLISAPVEVVFDLARSVRVHPLTTSWTKERVVSSHERDLLEKGDSITFSAVHFGVRQQLSARVTEVVVPELLVDEQVKGTFQSLRHIHRFEGSGGETKMVDDLEFRGPAGGLFDSWLVAPYMRRFLVRRGLELKRIAEAEPLD